MEVLYCSFMQTEASYLKCYNCNQPYVLEAESRRKSSLSSGGGHYQLRLPLLLKCGHVYCSVCLASLAKQLQSNSIPCPECRVSTPITPGVGMRAQLPVSVYTVGQIRAHQLGISKPLLHPVQLQPKDEEFIDSDEEDESDTTAVYIICEECDVKPATVRCSRCDSIYCEACFDVIHSSSKTLRTHRKIDLQDHHNHAPVSESDSMTANNEVLFKARNVQGEAEKELELLKYTIKLVASNDTCAKSTGDRSLEASREGTSRMIKQLEASFAETEKKYWEGRNSLVQENSSILKELRNIEKKIRLNVKNTDFRIKRKTVSEKDVEGLDELVRRASELRDRGHKGKALQVCVIPPFNGDISQIMKITEEVLKEEGEAEEDESTVSSSQSMPLSTSVSSPVFVDHPTVSDHKEQPIEQEQCTGMAYYSPPSKSSPPPPTVTQATTASSTGITDSKSDATSTSPVLVSPQKYTSPQKPLSASPSPMKSTLPLPRIHSGGSSSSYLSSRSRGSSRGSSRGNSPFKEQGQVSAEGMESTVGCKVTFVESPSEFWIQLEEDMVKLETLNKFIDKHCQSREEEASLKIGNVCAFRTREGPWRRGLIEKVTWGNPGYVVILQIDYGITNMVSFGNTRSIPEKWMVMDCLAHKCTLHGVQPPSPNFSVVASDWTQNAISYFRSVTLNQPNVRMKIFSKEWNSEVKAKVFCVDLYLPRYNGCGVSVSAQMIAQGKAQKVLEKPLKQGTLPVGPVPPIGSKIAVDLITAESPSDFYVQSSTDNKSLTHISSLICAYLVSGTTTVSSSRLIHGALVLAPYEDEYYRAVILKIAEKGVHVQYLDYGNKAVVGSDSCYEMSRKLSKIPPACYHCCLHESKREWTESVCDSFYNLANGESLLIEVKGTITSDGVLPVELYFAGSGKNIKDVKMSSGKGSKSLKTSKQAAAVPSIHPPSPAPSSSTPPPPPKKKDPVIVTPTFNYTLPTVPIGEQFKMLVTFVDDVGVVHGQPIENEKLVGEVDEAVHLIVTKFKPVSSCSALSVGQGCVAMYTGDDMWYRATVLSTTPEQDIAELWFIEFGNRALARSHQIIPCMAAPTIPQLSVSLPQYLSVPKEVLCTLLDKEIAVEISKNKTDVKIMVDGEDLREISYKLTPLPASSRVSSSPASHSSSSVYSPYSSS